MGALKQEIIREADRNSVPNAEQARSLRRKIRLLNAVVASLAPAGPSDDDAAWWASQNRDCHSLRGLPKEAI